jgi:hypothetical protein
VKSSEEGLGRLPSTSQVLFEIQKFPVRDELYLKYILSLMYSLYLLELPKNLDLFAHLDGAHTRHEGVGHLFIFSKIW